MDTAQCVHAHDSCCSGISFLFAPTKTVKGGYYPGRAISSNEIGGYWLIQRKIIFTTA
jgi:hypothetical protein